jgi:pyruvate dehydrogenase E2 component (dihydrolipoamide acetyltransferase)
MAVEFFIHKMSEHMETAQILKWYAREGEHVEKFQIIMEVMTDKVTAEMEAPEAGVIKGIRPGAIDGATVPVGEPICYIAAEDETVPALPPLPGFAAEAQIAEPALAAAAGGNGAPGAEKPGFSEKPGVLSEEVAGPRASPVARKVAKELGIDLNQVKGGGPLGRITESDVRAAAPAAKAEAASPTVSSSSSPSPVRAPVVAAAPVAVPAPTGVPQAGPSGPTRSLSLTPIQRVTGERMRESIVSAPQFAVDVMADMTQALWLREQLAERVKTDASAGLSMTGLLVKVAGAALKRHPRANAEFAGDHLMLHEDINIAVAIGTDDGLVVPVIRNADRKSLAEITKDLSRFQEQAKRLRFTADDLSGGTFTISNLGMFGVDHFQAIVNPPQAAILAVGRIQKIPVGLPDDGIALRPMMSLSLTVDHRCLDGLQAARLLAEIKELLEGPHLLLA